MCDRISVTRLPFGRLFFGSNFHFVVLFLEVLCHCRSIVSNIFYQLIQPPDQWSLSPLHRSRGTHDMIILLLKICPHNFKIFYVCYFCDEFELVADIVLFDTWKTESRTIKWFSMSTVLFKIRRLHITVKGIEVLRDEWMSKEIGNMRCGKKTEG